MAVGVTVMFTDLVGSTELAARLGADGADRLRRTHFTKGQAKTVTPKRLSSRQTRRQVPRYAGGLPVMIQHVIPSNQLGE